MLLHILFQRGLQREKQRVQVVATANVKLLHECEILRSRLEECSVNFLIEEEDKLIVDTSSPSDAIDLLATSDNRIGLLLAEVNTIIFLLSRNLERAPRFCFVHNNIFGSFYRILCLCWFRLLSFFLNEFTCVSIPIGVFIFI